MPLATFPMFMPQQFWTPHGFEVEGRKRTRPPNKFCLKIENHDFMTFYKDAMNMEFAKIMHVG